MNNFYLEREDKSSFLDLYNIDCMEFMSKCKDKQFDLVIVDPPYGINESNNSCFGKKRGKNPAALCKDYTKKDWDVSIPDDKYFDELFRVSKNQIIWGVNYYNNLQGGRVVWYKNVPEGYSKSKCELAYKSFGFGIDYFDYTWNGMIQENMKNKEERIHPTQKPVALYKWLLSKYAKPGDTILDTHLGSASIAIACWDMRYILTGCELDKEYFDTANERIKIHTTKKEKEEKFKELF